jgi:small subunit ribosomal protein S16
MLKLRLKRLGSTNNPSYKIVLMKNTYKRDGKVILNIGSYNPLQKTLQINKNLLYKAIQTGAYPTNTLRHLLYKLLPSNTLF